MRQPSCNARNGFVMCTRELIDSPSWRRMSINCKRLIDFLMSEHLSKGGRENGDLKATYDQLVAAGISRRYVNRTISEAEDLGLLWVERGGRRGCVNDVSTFTLTFTRTMRNGRAVPPTNDYLKLTAQEVDELLSRRISKSTLRRGTHPVPLGDSTQFH